MDGSDQAVRNRIRYIPFLNKFTPSAANIQKVENLKRNHKDAFFSWCVLGAKKFYDTGILPHTQLQQETTQTFANDNDTLVAFIKECCVTEEKTLNPLTKRNKTTVSPINTFKADYQNMYPKASVESLKADMKTKGFISKMDSTGKISYFGIRAKTTDDLKAEADADAKAVTDAEAQANAQEDRWESSVTTAAEANANANAQEDRGESSVNTAANEFPESVDQSLSFPPRKRKHSQE